MRIIAQVCWFDEPPELLEHLIWSLAPLVDAAVFVDGAYADFPHDDFRSPDEQYEAIGIACASTGIECHFVTPDGAWETQMAKRTSMFSEAVSIGRVYEDFSLIIDADEHLRFVDPVQVRARLASMPDVGLVSLDTPSSDRYDASLRGIHSPRNSTMVHGKGVPRVMRLLEDVRIGPRHHGAYTGVAEDGRRVVLKDRQRTFRRMRAATHVDLRDVLAIENGTWSRSEQRIAAKHSYGLIRELHGRDL